MAACGHAHTLAVTKAGLLWAWGEGEGRERETFAVDITLM
jgi:alpha-tubulin suppressor-like RCC1 family protein